MVLDLDPLYTRERLLGFTDDFRKNLEYVAKEVRPAECLHNGPCPHVHEHSDDYHRELCHNSKCRKKVKADLLEYALEALKHLAEAKITLKITSKPPKLSEHPGPVAEVADPHDLSKDQKRIYDAHHRNRAIIRNWLQKMNHPEFTTDDDYRRACKEKYRPASVPIGPERDAMAQAIKKASDDYVRIREGLIQSIKTDISRVLTEPGGIAPPYDDMYGYHHCALFYALRLLQPCIQRFSVSRISFRAWEGDPLHTPNLGIEGLEVAVIEIIEGLGLRRVRLPVLHSLRLSGNMDWYTTVFNDLWYWEARMPY